VGGPNFTNPTNIIRIGEPVGAFWGLTRLGVWSEAERDQAAKFTSYRNGLTILPGDIKYKDFNGDNAITDADRRIIGNGSPDFWGSLTNTFKYNNFDLMLELAYSYGNDVMLMNLHPSEDRQALANSYSTVLNAWTPTNQNTMIAEIRDTRAGYVTNVDTWWIKDGSFLRGRNLLLGYTFPSNVASKLKLSRLRVYGTAQNFFLLIADKDTAKVVRSILEDKTNDPHKLVIDVVRAQRISDNNFETTNIKFEKLKQGFIEAMEKAE
jgi:hypothetical protein